MKYKILKQKLPPRHLGVGHALVGVSKKYLRLNMDKDGSKYKFKLKINSFKLNIRLM